MQTVLNEARVAFISRAPPVENTFVQEFYSFNGHRPRLAGQRAAQQRHFRLFWEEAREERGRFRANQRVIYYGIRMDPVK